MRLWVEIGVAPPDALHALCTRLKQSETALSALKDTVHDSNGNFV